MKFGIILTSLLLISNISIAQQNNSTKSEALSVIFNRKSVRNYTGEPISRDIIDTIIRAGMAAPSAMNKQPWVFIVVDNKEKLLFLSDSLNNSRMLRKAAVAIIVCGDMSKAIQGAEEFWIQDCSAASQNILLAVEALNLGAVWTGIYPYIKKTEFLKNYFNLPEHIIPLNVIAIGVPDGEFLPKNKYKPENIHWNAW